VAAHDRIDPEGRPGPGSIAWRVNGERVAVLGWGRAILLQLAHPLVAQGVADHSSFRGGPLAAIARFHATLRAMLALTFGSTQQAGDMIRHIRGVHDRVHGTLPQPAGHWPGGAGYSAHDPSLLAWVNLTLVDSVPLVFDRFVAPLDETDVGRYAEQSRWSAELIGVHPDDVPRSAVDLRRRMTEVLESGTLSVTPRARALGRAVVGPPLGWMSGPVGQLHALAAIAWLPPALRDAYGFGWTREDDRRLAAWTRRMRAWSARAPVFVRRWGAARRADRIARRGAWPMP
jgi:uncharacterized protein (DUF2236 family)